MSGFLFALAAAQAVIIDSAMIERVAQVAKWPIDEQVRNTFTSASEQELHELSYCMSDENGQPFRFCLNNRRWERGRVELDAALKNISAAIETQDRTLREFTKISGGVTFVAKAKKSFHSSQKLWGKSYAADCTLVGISMRTGNAGTEGVTANWGCEADRILERVAFLRRTYDLSDLGDEAVEGK